MKTATKSTQEVIFHTVKVEKKNILEKFIQVVYLPKETQQLIDNEAKANQSYVYQFCLSEFRAIIQGRYHEVICADFSTDVVNGDAPWLYIQEDAPSVLGSLIHQRFIQWFSRLLEKKRNYKIPESFTFLELPLLKVSLADCFQFRARNKVISSWLLQQFCLNQKKVLWDVPNSKGVDHEIKFPDEWYFNFNGSSTEAISNLVFITKLKSDDNGEQYASYVINLLNDESSNEDEIILHLKSGLRRWNYKPLMKGDWLDFPRNNKRSLYLIKSDRSGRRLLRCVMSKFENKPLISFYKQTVEMFEEMGFSPNLRVILSDPKRFYHGELVALIPYIQDDKGYPNMIESGISKVEKTRIFDMFTDLFPFLQNAHQAPQKISTLPTTLKGGKVVLDHFEESISGKLVIEIFSKDLSLPRIIETSLEEFTQIEGYDPRLSFNKISELVYHLVDKTTGEWLEVELVDMSNYVFLAQDLPYSTGGKTTSERIRKKEIVETLPFVAFSCFSLVEIGSYDDNGDSDPKQIIEKAFLERGRLTQCFHSISGEEEKYKIKSCLADIFARKGFVNQMYSTYKQSFDQHTYYFPVCLKTKSDEKKEGFIYVMSRFKEGKIDVQYKNSDWMSIEESLLYLTNKNKQKLFQEGRSDFMRFIESTAKTNNDIVVFQLDEFKAAFAELDTTKLNFTVATFDTAPQRNPYIDYQQKGIPSTGAFLVVSNGQYYAIPPKMKDNIGFNYNTKQDKNKPFRSRQTMCLKVSSQDDLVAANLFLMRNLSVTFQYYLNSPLPYHILNNHRKFV